MSLSKDYDHHVRAEASVLLDYFNSLPPITLEEELCEEAVKIFKIIKEEEESREARLKYPSTGSEYFYVETRFRHIDYLEGVHRQFLQFKDNNPDILIEICPENVSQRIGNGYRKHFRVKWAQ